MSASLQFAMSNATPGMEEEFERWYGQEHLPHVLRVPGVLAGQRFRRVRTESLPNGPHEYLVIWEFDDPQLALQQLARSKGGEEMPISPAIDMATLQPPTMWLRATVRNATHPVSDTSTRGPVLLALVNPEPQAGDALERELLTAGLGRLADVPGVLCAHLLTLTAEQIRGNARKFQYGLFFELADEGPVSRLSSLLAALPRVDRSKWMASLYRPLATRVVAGSPRTAESLDGLETR